LPLNIIPTSISEKSLPKSYITFSENN